MKTIDLADANQSLASFVRNADAKPLVVTKAGKPVAALIPVDEDGIESLAVSSSPVFRKLILHSRERLRKEGGIPEEEVKRRLGQRR